MLHASSVEGVTYKTDDCERRIELMNKVWLAVLGIVAIVAVYGIIVLLLVKLLWAWTIPDIFPGAVEQGLIARDISWITAFKIGVFVAVLAGLAGARRGQNE